MKAHLNYVKYVLEPIFRRLKKGRLGENGKNEYTSLPPFMIKNIMIPFPVDSNGELNLLLQDEITQQLDVLNEIKDSMQSSIDAISNASISLDVDDYRIEYYPLPLLFSTTKGLSKYTKKYGNNNCGEYPVYSASSFAPLTFINTYDYDGKYMTWSTNGFAGTILILDGKFSINGDRGILVPRDGRTDLDFEYMKYTLEPIFREMAKGRKGDNGEDEFTKLYPSMLNEVMIPVPVDKDGNIDLSAQKEISTKYLSVEQCKKEIVEKLQTLINQKINI